MNRKGALELSINAIVILIIALAVLGLIIGFVVSQFGSLGEQIRPTENTADATAQNTITLPGGNQRFNVPLSGSLLMEVGVYANTAIAAGAVPATPTILSCGATDPIKATAVCPAIASGESGKCSVTIDPETTATLDTEYGCVLALGGRTKTIFLTVQ